MSTPPFFIGLMLVFWGWEAGLLAVGVTGAVILELSRVIRWRWDFSEMDMRRVWDLCGVLFLAAVVYGYATTDIAAGPAKFMPWLPMILFPFVLATAYSAQDRVRFSTYFWLLRRKGRAVAPDKPLGWFVPYWYFVAGFIAASMVNARDYRFYAGVVVFGAWLLWIHRNRSAPIGAWTILVLAAAAAGFGGHIGLARLQALIENRAGQVFEDLIASDTDVSQTRTAIGSVGKLKESNRIVLRLETDGGQPPPELLRRASYTTYHSSGDSAVWSTERPDFGPVSASGEVGTWILAPRRDTSSVVTVSLFLLGGTGILPVPNGSATLEGLLAASVQTNGCGSVRAREAPPLARYAVRYGETSTVDHPPDAADLAIPKEEAPALTAIAEEAGLASRPPAEVLRRIQAFFQDKFTYRTYLQSSPYDPSGRTTPLSRFLLHDRAGHCEYFATATTLLLRQAGISARYAVGFAVPESSGKDRVRIVRARHAHAWALAYVNGSWRDFDTTPAAWDAIEANAQRSMLQPLTDLLTWVRYAFARWRYYGERGAATRVVWWLAAIVVVWFLWRIFGKKSRAGHRPEQSKQDAPPGVGLDSEFYRIEQHFAKAGIPRRRQESWSEWLNRVESAGQPAPAVRPLRNIVRLHYAYRFDPRGLTDPERRQLRTSVEAWLKAHGEDGNRGRTGKM